MENLGCEKLHRQIAGENEQHQAAGGLGVQPKAQLEQERQQEGQGPDGDPQQRAAPDRDGESGDGERRQIQQGRRMATEMADAGNGQRPAGRDHEQRAQG